MRIAEGGRDVGMAEQPHDDAQAVAAVDRDRRGECLLFRFRNWRHTLASRGIMSGVDLPTVGTLLGHKRLSTSAIYTHLDDSALQAAAEQAAGKINPGFRLEIQQRQSEPASALPPLGHGVSMVRSMRYTAGQVA